MSNIAFLSRQSTTKPPLSNPAIAKLGKKALEILGYEQTRIEENVKMMMGILYQYELLPFEPSTVRYYENICLDEANAKLWQSVIVKIVLFFSRAFLVLASGPLVLGMSGIISRWIGLMSFCVIIVACIGEAACQIFNKVKSRAVWREVTIDEYEGIIPSLALQAAVDIKIAIPTAIITVEQLEQDIEVLDPFLVVRIGKQKFHFAVWDEKNFQPGL